MTQLLGPMTAYGAIAIMAWVAVLLYPRLIPSAAVARLDRRWRWARGFALALAASIGLNWLHGRGLLPADDSIPGALTNRLLIYAPLLAFIFARRSLAAALLPKRGLLRSLGIGAALGLAALAAWLWVAGSPGGFGAFATGLAQPATAVLVLRTLLFDLALGAALALLADGWSQRVALLVTTVAVLGTHLALSLAGGLDGGEVAGSLAAGAVALGLFSAILASRNAAWFFPVHLLLSLALAQNG